MNYFRTLPGEKVKRGGFSLAESALSIGLISFGLLTLVPLLALGLKTSRLARDDRAGAEIRRLNQSKVEAVIG